MKNLMRSIISVSLSLAVFPINSNSTHLLSQLKEESYVKIIQKLLITENLESDPFALMREESLGKLKLDLFAQQVIQLLGNPRQKGGVEFWAGDALYHQYWYYPNQGITLSMASETEKGQQNIAFIKLVFPSTLPTKRGITIGSSIEEVSLAYAKEKDQEMSIPDQTFVAGSIYGGLIFTFDNGRVIEIFLGAAAE
ncbi:hypothetical protein [Microcystis aeruginosa]|uniref:hypothetical protein n=1 Tax=Microcystis aeruginosa TaxID=1126 RepID=UPI00232E877C|nr:hypothetical protein [Microcystis aeruginosa]MDB9411792.1 hypothetical protein [Microcystis aeruginosa CS-567/02]